MSRTFFEKSLFIDWSDSVGHECYLSISTWDSGLVVTGYSQEETQRLSLIDVGDWIFGIEDPAIKRWRDTLPAPVNDGLSTLPSHQASILRWAVDSPVIVDLLTSNPLLLWLLVDEGLFGHATLGEINRRLSVKQKQLCHELGLAGTEQQVKIFRRAASAHLSAFLIRDLLRILKNETVCKFLSHRSDMSASDIEILKQYPWIVRYPCRALLEELKNPETLRFFQDVIRMLADLGPLYQCRTAAAVRRLHDGLVEYINRDDGFTFFRDDYGDIQELPSPPLPGNDFIRPLTTQHEIVKEGREMRHCIASYIGSVVRGEYYVYQMTRPERLTIGVLVGLGRSNDRWQHCFVREVRGKYNHHPSEASTRLIEDWFESAQLNNDVSHTAREL